MAKLSHKIWYGTFHHGDDIHQPSMLPILGWTILLAALFSLRLHLPFIETPPQEIHQAILDSLIHGQIWGRQALVGSPEFPLLTTLALFVASGLAGWLNLPPAYLLVSAAQVWVLFYGLRFGVKPGSRWLTGLLLLLLFILSPQARQIIYRVDPNWAVAVPLTCGLYHFMLWCRTNSLRDIVLLGVNCGLLVFAGPVGLLIGLVVLGTVTVRLLNFNRDRPPGKPASHGLHLLAWSPALYSLVLLFLANWLIMEHPFFLLQRFSANLIFLNQATILQTGWQSLANFPWYGWGGLAIALLNLRNSPDRAWATVIIVGMITLLAVRIALDQINYFAPAIDLVGWQLALAGLLLPLWATRADGARHRYWRLGELLIILTAVVLGHAAPRTDLPQLDLFNPPPPSRQAVLNTIERHTPETRIMVYGLQAPARYLDLNEERFVARFEFDWATLSQYLEQEPYFYLLIPPDNGKFYSPDSPLAKLHQRGHPWLVLETRWPGGWLLWRVLQPAQRFSENQ